MEIADIALIEVHSQAQCNYSEPATETAFM